MLQLHITQTRAEDMPESSAASGSFLLRAGRALARFACGAAVAMASVSAFAAPELGVYRWDAPSGPSNVDGFSQWLGRPVGVAAAFEARSSWDDIDGASWQLDPWSRWVRAQYGRNLSLGVPLLPSSGGSLANCAAGQYDVYWRNLANNLAYYGLHWAYLRLGWEMDGTWYAWSAAPGSGKEASFAGCFRRVVQVMRQAQPANQWKFVLGTAMSWQSATYLNAVWPGDSYVDVVAIDLYDQSWATNTYPYPSTCDASCRLTRQQNAWNDYSSKLYALRDFAVAHGKQMAFPEWGVGIRPDGHAGGDNPYYIRKMYDFIQDPNNYVAYYSYWDVQASDFDAQLSGSTKFPDSAALFKQLFGATTTTSTTTSSGPTGVTFNAPLQNATISGSFSDSSACEVIGTGISRVVFSMDTTQLNTENYAPWQCSFDTRQFANGTHTLRAVAYNSVGASTTVSRNVNVQNTVTSTTDSTPPTVSLTSPAAGTVIQRRTTVTLDAAASDNVGVAAVEFLVNNAPVCLVKAAPYRCAWNTGTKFERSYVITTRATDAAGNAGLWSGTYQSAK